MFLKTTIFLLLIIIFIRWQEKFILLKSFKSELESKQKAKLKSTQADKNEVRSFLIPFLL